MKRTPFKRKPKKKKTSKGLFKHLKKESKAVEWARIRKELLKEFEAMGINYCEARYNGCAGTFGLAFAHRFKRRLIPKEEPQRSEELRTVAYLCVKCHELLEHSGHEIMYNSITKIIEERNNRLSRWTKI